MIVYMAGTKHVFEREKTEFITLYLGRCREQKFAEYPDLMAAYSHPREQQPLPPGQQGDFSVGFVFKDQSSEEGASRQVVASIA